MQYELILTGKFKKSLKLARKRGLDIALLEDILPMLLDTYQQYQFIIKIADSCLDN